MSARKFSYIDNCEQLKLYIIHTMQGALSLGINVLLNIISLRITGWIHTYTATLRYILIVISILWKPI